MNEDKLEEFTMFVDWHTPKKETFAVFARNLEDAKEIATILFKKRFSEECIVDTVRRRSYELSPIPPV